MSDLQKAKAAPKAAPVTTPILRFRMKATPMRAIAAFCSHCVGCTDDGIEPGFRQDIATCAATACPLYTYRPYKGRQGSPDDA